MVIGCFFSNHAAGFCDCVGFTVLVGLPVLTGGGVVAAGLVSFGLEFSLLSISPGSSVTGASLGSGVASVFL